MSQMLKTLVAGALLVPSLGFAADGLSHNYVEASYLNLDLDNVNVDGDGFGLKGSLAIHPNWHLVAGYQQADLDNNVDYNRWNIGVGYNMDLNQTTELIGRALWVNAEVEQGNVSNDEDGFGLQALLRGRVIENMDLEGGVQYVDFGGEDGDDTSFIGEGRYFFTPTFAAGLGVEIGDDATQWNANFRFNFK